METQDSGSDCTSADSSERGGDAPGSCLMKALRETCKSPLAEVLITNCAWDKMGSPKRGRELATVE